MGGDGGGLRVVSGTANLNDVALTNNRVDVVDGGAGQNGGALVSGGVTTLNGCVVSGNRAIAGGGVAATASSLTLIDCTVGGNTAIGPGGDLGGQGGGVLATGARLTMSGSTVAGNTAQGPKYGSSFTLGGGVYSANNQTTMANCTIAGNSSGGAGGGIALNSQTGTTITNCTITGNSSATNGGGLYNVPFGVTLANTIVAGQKAGGDIANGFEGPNNLVGVDPMLSPLGDFGGPTMTMVPLPGSPARSSGLPNAAPATDQRGLPRSGFVDAGAFQTQPGLVVNATSDGNASDPGELNLRQAINLANTLSTADTITFSPLFNAPQTIALNGGQLTLLDKATTTILGPGANLLSINGTGGGSRCVAVYGGSASLQGLTLSGGGRNVVAGGGLYNSGGTVSLTACVISGSSAISYGGGLYNKEGTTTLTDCAITGNSNLGNGAGVSVNGGTVKLTGCFISGNDASTGGGGFDNRGGTLLLTNSTVSGNTSAGGGGFYHGSAGGDTTLINVTVTGNHATDVSGGGIASFGGTFTLINTIVAGNTGGDINFFMAPLNGSNYLIGGNPLLGPLGNYGGPTQTFPLLPGSPAIGAGTAVGAPTIDQRGLPTAGRVDIGAFQSQGFTVTPAAGRNGQSTTVDRAFPNPVAVVVTANNPVEPVDGGIINFGVTPVGGASATLSAASATIAGGRASVTATAGGTAGTYLVTATAAGAGETGLALTNTAAIGVTGPPLGSADPADRLTVTTALDVVDANDGQTSLREAIAYANAHPGPDTILLAPGLLGSRRQTIGCPGDPWS